MLQYIIKSDNAQSMSSIAKLAIENECKWIRINVSLLAHDEVETCIKAVQEMCKQHECILTIDDEVETAKQAQLDGVHLTKMASISPVEARKQLGEEPIMGITINEASEVPFLPRTAVDYIEVDGVEDINCYREIVKQMKQMGLEEPVVARLNDTTTVNRVMATGINGIALQCVNIPAIELPPILQTLATIVEQRLERIGGD